MGNNKHILFIILLLFVGKSYGQNMLTKCIVIDSLEFGENIDSNKWEVNSCSILSFKSYGYIIDTYQINKKRSNVILIKYLKGDSLSAKLTIDDKCSELWLNHVENLSDTIHISKWNIFHNELADSISKLSGYYHYRDGDTSDIKWYKQTSSNYRVDNNSNKKEEITLKVNEVVYKSHLMEEPEPSISVSYDCGNAKKIDEKRKYKGLRYNRFPVRPLLLKCAILVA